MLDLALDPLTLLRRPLRKLQRGAEAAGRKTAKASRAAVVVGSANEVFTKLLEGVNDFRDRFRAELVVEMEEAIKSGGSLWPVRTGESKKAMAAGFEGDDLVVRNTTRYAIFVDENRQRGGRPNPNFQAVDRTMAKLWPAMQRRALRRVAESYGPQPEIPEQVG